MKQHFSIIAIINIWMWYVKCRKETERQVAETVNIAQIRKESIL